MSRVEIRQLCDASRGRGFGFVCVRPQWVSTCRALLGGSGVRVCAVLGLEPRAAARPLAAQARAAADDGAGEIDLVVNRDALRRGDYGAALREIQDVLKAARPARLKLVLECATLTPIEKVQAITLAKLGGAHFVKTSSRFVTGASTSADLAQNRRLMGAAETPAASDLVIGAPVTVEIPASTG